MSQKISRAVAARVVAALLAIPAGPALAQSLDLTGSRPAAMGAFVAVADDATAVVWNPAGLVNGPMFNLVIDFGRKTAVPRTELLDSTHTATRSGSSFVAASIPPLGVSYSRGRITRITPSETLETPAAEPLPSRDIKQLVVRSLATSHLGVTVVQSVGDRLTVGATGKLVRGEFSAGLARATSWDMAFDRAEMLGGHSQTTADVDLGALFWLGTVRLGVVARNLTEPAFDDGRIGGASVRLERHVRAGLAWGNGWPGIATTIVAVDADLTRAGNLTGVADRADRSERRDIGAGAERWFRRQRVAVRGGIKASTVGSARPAANVGGSLQLRNGIFIDGYVSRGRDEDHRWGIAGRLLY